MTFFDHFLIHMVSFRVQRYMFFFNYQTFCRNSLVDSLKTINNELKLVINMGYEFERFSLGERTAFSMRINGFLS